MCVSFQAKEAIREAEENDSESAVVYFYKFKIALLEGQDDLGEYGYIITTSGNPKTSEINNSSLLYIHPTLSKVMVTLFTSILPDSNRNRNCEHQQECLS